MAVELRNETESSILRVRVWAFLKSVFSRRKVVSVTVELCPAFINDEGKRMYKVGWRTYVEESDLLKAFDKAVERGKFHSCEIMHDHQRAKE